MMSSEVLACTLLVLVSTGAYAQQTCEADHQCPSDRFCYESRVCAPCIACAAYNRHHGTSHCAKEWQACGTCLPGFASEDLPGALKRGNCFRSGVPSVDPSQPTAGEMKMSPGIPQNLQIFMIVAIVLSLGSGTVYLAIKGRQRMRRLQPDVECGRQVVQEAPLLSPALRPLPLQDTPPPGQDTPPPEYSRVEMPVPSAPPEYGDVTGVITMTGVVSEMRDEKLLQARPCNVPANHRYHWDPTHEEVVLQELSDDDSQSARSTPSNLGGEESTLPSNWVPSNEDLRVDGSLEDSGVCNVSEGASSSSDALPGPLDFHGLFVDGTLVVQTEARSPRVETGERPAKRFRADSGSHSVDSHSSSDEETHAGQPTGRMSKLGLAGKR